MVAELSSLMPPGAEEQLLDHMVRRTRFFVPATKAEQAAAIVPWSIVNALISGGSLPYEHFRLIRSNRTVPYEMFCRPGQRPEVRPGALHQLVTQGVSVIINRIDKYVTTVGELAAGLERKLGSEVQVNCYISFAKDNAFLAHHDGHDVVVLQVHGRKHWRTFGMVKEGQPSMTAQEAKNAVPEWEQSLSPGDILFVPRGEIHDASALTSDSLHLTIGIHSRKGADVLRWLADQARGGSLLDTGLMRLGGEQAVLQQEATLKQHLHALVDQIELKKYLNDDDARRAPRSLISIPVTQALNPHTRIVLALRRNVRLPDADGAVTIGGEEIKLQKSDRSVLSLLMKKTELAYGELEAALSGQVAKAELETALRRLAGGGLIALVDGP